MEIEQEGNFDDESPFFIHESNFRANDDEFLFGVAKPINLSIFYRFINFIMFGGLDQLLIEDGQMEEEIQIENINLVKNEAVVVSNPSQIKEEEEDKHEDDCWAANILNKSETYLKIMRRRPIHMSSNSSLSDA